jgi:hypothetical protein
MSVLTLADAKTHINIGSAVTTYDTEIQAVINSAEAALSVRCGPLASVAYTERIAGGTGSLFLRQTPVVSLTSITPHLAAALTLSDVYLDKVTGQVMFNDLRGFPAIYYDVVYSSGRASCPDDLLFAVKEMVRLMWTSQRGPTARESQETATSATQALKQVAGLIAPHIQVPAG